MHLESNELDAVEAEASEPIVVVPDVVLECQDYSAELSEIRAELVELQEQVAVSNGYQAYMCGFLLFLVVCVLCVAIHKFFKLFF